MKQKIKFGVIDIILCVLLVALIGVNVYAYSGDIASAFSKGGTGKPSGAASSTSGNIEPVPLKAAEVTADVVEGQRRMNLFFCDDDDYDSWFIYYELDITLTEVSRDVYRIDVTTSDAEYADGTSDGLENIEGTATGTVEDGILCFTMPGLESAPLHMNYFYFEDEIVAIAYESDSLSTTCYAAEMFIPE